MSKDDDKIGDGTTTGVVIKVRPKTKKPALYKVIMLNDDYTPMEFVIHVLERFFSKTREEATAIMLHVHQRGVGCGVTPEVAETKVMMMDFAVSTSTHCNALWKRLKPWLSKNLEESLHRALDLGATANMQLLSTCSIP